MKFNDYQARLLSNAAELGKVLVPQAVQNDPNFGPMIQELVDNKILMVSGEYEYKPTLYGQIVVQLWEMIEKWCDESYQQGYQAGYAVAKQEVNFIG